MCGHLTFTSIYGSAHTVVTHFEAHSYLEYLCTTNVVALNIPFIGAKGSNHVLAGQCSCAQSKVHKGLPRIKWKNLNGLYKALISTPMSTFRMKWNTDFALGLLVKHHCPPFVGKWAQSPAATVQNVMESFFRAMDTVIATKRQPIPY